MPYFSLALYLSNPVTSSPPKEDSWTLKMVVAFGANKHFWREHHGTKLNDIGLIPPPHKAMDAESRIRLALPDLQQGHSKTKKKSF